MSLRAPSPAPCFILARLFTASSCTSSSGSARAIVASNGTTSALANAFLSSLTAFRRTLAFGWWGVSDPVALEAEMAEAFLEGPSRHTNTTLAGRALVATDPRLELDRVQCPCLCLWGTRDNWVPLADGFEYARRLRAPLRTIADCGHLLIGERPDVVLRAIREFLAGLG